MTKNEIIYEVKKYYPVYTGNELSIADYYNTQEIKRLKILLKKKHSQNEWFLNIPKWFVLEKWPKPIFTRQANIQDPIWPYFSIWIHDFINGIHYTLSASHIIPFFLVYKWNYKYKSKEGFDYFAEPLNREEYFNNLIFDGFNPESVVGIDIKSIEDTYLKYLGVELFKDVGILDEHVPEVYFENRIENNFLIRSLFDGLTKHKLNKPYLDELHSGLL